MGAARTRLPGDPPESARDIALAAWGKAERIALARAREEAEAAEARAKAAREARQAKVAGRLRLFLDLIEPWFPGCEWRVVDDGEDAYFSELVIVPRLSHPGDSLKLSLDRDDVTVRAVSEQYEDGYLNWRGPKVESAADVGRFLTNHGKLPAKT